MGVPHYRGKHVDRDSLFIPPLNGVQLDKNSKYPLRPKCAIMVFSGELLDDIVKNNIKGLKKLDFFWYKAYGLTKYKNKICVVGGFGVGAPTATIVLEELIASGVKYIIAIGTAGFLSQNKESLRIAVCARAIRDEGTSHHYIAPSKYAYPSKEINNALMRSLNDHNMEFSVGTSWTIDAPYRETRKEISKYSREGVLTAEMEASALFAVGKYRKVKVGAAFVSSDFLREDQHVGFWGNKQLREMLHSLFIVAVDSLKQYV